ncbi:MAG: hypothetical protein IJ153_08695 [Clostridia bacterium]|nr:hypothetical protein [Clostridia bacterium]
MSSDGEARADRSRIRGSINLRILFQALVTYVGVSYQLELNSMIDYWGLQGFTAVRWNLGMSFDPFSLAHFLLLPGLYLLYAAIFSAWDKAGEKTWNVQRAGRLGPRAGLTVQLPAAMFAAMMVLGWSFAKYNSWVQVLTLRHGQLIKSLIVFWGYDLLFRYVIQYLYLKLSLGFSGLAAFPSRKWRLWGWYESKLRRAPFRTVALTLLILYLPLMLISYPGLIVSDTVGQTLIGFPALAETEAGLMSKPGWYLNNHHPVAHTMLIHLCLVVGQLMLHSWNAGYYLYTWLQALAFISTVAFLVREYIRKYGIPTWYVVGLVAYIFVSPLIHNYFIMNTKDVFYSLFLLLTMYFWYQLLTTGGTKNLLLLLLFGAGTILFRNEGQYVLMLSAIGSLFLNRERRKQFALVLLAVVVFSVGYFHLLFPALGIVPGSRREMLSIPFQQTARYLTDHGDQVTAAERETIDAVLIYEQISESYDPELSDPVKDLYREEATSGEVIRYMITWAKMGVKHPSTYLSAFLNNKFDYFYPDHELLSFESYKRTSFLFSWITELAEKVGVAPAQPVRLKRLRDLSDDVWGWLRESTPLSLLVSTSLYPWLVILLFCYSLRKRDRRMISLCLIPVIVLLVCMTGPTNGNYSRYTFPLALALPFFGPVVHPLASGDACGKQERGVS